MSGELDKQLLARVQAGDERAFEQVYAACAERVRLMAWRLTRREQGVDDLFNETWCRAFSQRTKYDSQRPFLVWMAGILKNVYRETVRKRTDGPPTQDGDSRIDSVSPEMIASEAESLVALKDCVERLGAEDARIVELRFFAGMTLRSVAKELSIPESTIRDTRLPVIMEALRRCLEKKGVDFSFFSAQGGIGLQYRGEDQ
jgi:RNA polymerase sigma-70 factor (ECF subfamily)